MQHFESYITISTDGYDLRIFNKKSSNIEIDGNFYKWVESSASCKLDDIQGIVYGGFSSRFWMLRKHINSIPPENLSSCLIPFYSWECISIQMPHRNVDLVIKDEEDMSNLLTLLVYSIQTIDGNKGSAIPYLYNSSWSQTNHIYHKVLLKYKIMKWRAKISYMAFE